MKRLMLIAILFGVSVCTSSLETRAQGFGIGFGSFGPGFGYGGFGPGIGSGISIGIGSPGYSRFGYGGYGGYGYRPYYSSNFGGYGGYRSYGYSSYRPSYGYYRPNYNSYYVRPRGRCR